MIHTKDDLNQQNYLPSVSVSDSILHKNKERKMSAYSSFRKKEKYLDTVLNGDTGEGIELGHLVLYIFITIIHTFSSTSSASATSPPSI